MRLSVRFISVLLVLLLLASCGVSNRSQGQTEATENVTADSNVAFGFDEYGTLIFDKDGKPIERKIISGENPIDETHQNMFFRREDVYNERLKDEYESYINLAKIGKYNIVGDNEKLSVDKLNITEFKGMVGLIGLYEKNSIFGNFGKHMILTIANFDDVKPISEIKVIKTEKKTKAYNIYTMDNNILCIIYDCIDDVLYFDRVVFFDDLQSYYLLTQNEKLTYREVRTTKRNLYKNYKKITRLSDVYMSHIDVPHWPDKWTTHMTDKGFLFIGYDRNKDKKYTMAFTVLSRGILKKVHRSLLNDVYPYYVN